jgi:uncharacterized peroxidase-related enzyme
MHLLTIEAGTGNASADELFAADMASDGFVHQYTRLFTLNPAAYKAWHGLARSIRRGMRLRRYELITLAAANALRCRYCVSAHADVVLGAGLFTVPEVEAILRDFRTAGLEPVEVVLMTLAEKVALDASAVTAPDIEAARAFGLNDEEIFSVILAAAARAFFSKTLDASGCLPDEELAATNDLLPSVRNALPDVDRNRSERLDAEA